MIVNRDIRFRFWNFGSFIYCDTLQSITMVSKETGRPLNQFPTQQYTETKDRDGKEIYEGDIISCDEYMGNGMKDFHRPITVVMFDGCSWCYSLDKTRNWKNPHQILRYARNVKVIGNIYENPELL